MLDRVLIRTRKKDLDLGNLQDSDLSPQKPDLTHRKCGRWPVKRKPYVLIMGDEAVAKYHGITGTMASKQILILSVLRILSSYLLV